MIDQSNGFLQNRGHPENVLCCSGVSTVVCHLMCYLSAKNKSF